MSLPATHCDCQGHLMGRGRHAPSEYAGALRRLAVSVMIWLAMCVGSVASAAQSVKDINYGAVLFAYHQRDFFNALVELEIVEAQGGVRHHGTFPTLLKGGVSVLYGLDQQAQRIFEQVLAHSADVKMRNRAWFYLAKLRHQRGDAAGALRALANIEGAIEEDLRAEYDYLRVNAQLASDQSAQAYGVLHEVGRDAVYAPYLYYNLGMNAARQGDFEWALTLLETAAGYANASQELRRLADRAYLAAGRLQQQRKRYGQAQAYFERVHTTGLYSSQALLAYSRSVIGSGQASRAVAPLQLLGQRSLAVPEVQEALALLPSVYEQLAAPGLAVHGFEQAVSRYEEGLAMVATVSRLLRDSGFIELFAANLDANAGASHWFGLPPAIQHNALSPFIAQWMADHSFQAVLKDLRDLYALRNNLVAWQRQSRNFAIIQAARADAARQTQVTDRLTILRQTLATRQEAYRRLARRVEQLADSKQRRRIRWLGDDLQRRLVNLETKLGVLAEEANWRPEATDGVIAIDALQRRIASQLQRTQTLLARVEARMHRLIQAELKGHETRIRGYLAQSRLALARLYDKALLSESSAIPAGPASQRH